MQNNITKTPVWNNDIALCAADLLLDTGSYLVDFDREYKDWYVWKSGIVAPSYCNCRYINTSAQASQQIATFLKTIVNCNFSEADVVVGLATAGIPWATRVADSLSKPMSFVRSAPKSYGVGGTVECSPSQNSRAVIIDDLCASGGSLVKAIQNLSDEKGITTIGVVTIVNWGFEAMYSKLNTLDIPILCVTSYPQIITSAQNKGVINSSQADKLLKFYQSPSTFDWSSL